MIQLPVFFISSLLCIAAQRSTGDAPSKDKYILSCFFSVIPRILDHPRDVEIQPHSTAYFPCRYSTPPSITQVSWFLEGRQLVVFGSAGSNSAEILGDGTLVIKSVDSAAGGRYSCRITTEVKGEGIMQQSYTSVLR